jgi:hypothetical protein
MGIYHSGGMSTVVPWSVQISGCLLTTLASFCIDTGKSKSARGIAGARENAGENGSDG